MPLALLLAALPIPAPPLELGGWSESSQPVLVLERTPRRLANTGDPIWDLRLQIPGEPERHFEAVSGRADRQAANRNQLGSEAPLPVGSYWIGAVEPLGRHGPRELGPIWIGIEPQFKTGRRVLGIHLDPSAGRNWNSGTSGCVGLIRERDMHTLAELLRRSGTSTLVVAN
ncbi:MAG: hypothetical protein RLZZ515_642 [Cyanobacteriota bacterium]